MMTTTAPLTLEEFARLPHTERRYEISAGELITMPLAKSLHTVTALAVLEALQSYLRQYDDGLALPQASYVLSRDPLTIRQPDVSILSKDRVRATPSDEYFQGAPELAVEIISPTNSAEDLDLKVEQYFDAGAKQVWVLYPRTRRIHVFHSSSQEAHRARIPRRQTERKACSLWAASSARDRCARPSEPILNEAQILEGGDLLPGFAAKVVDLFSVKIMRRDDG
jgi:Uma2 family endonuclease